jgi:hypothetical protein
VMMCTLGQVVDQCQRNKSAMILSMRCYGPSTHGMIAGNSKGAMVSWGMVRIDRQDGMTSTQNP